MKKKQCTGITKKGKQCTKPAIVGSSRCHIHPEDDGGDAQKPKGGGKGPGGVGKTIGTFSAGIAIKEVFGGIWEWLKENAEIFLTATQFVLYAKITKKNSEGLQSRQLAKLLSTLSTEQWAQLLLAVGSSRVKKTAKRKRVEKTAKR